MLCFYFVLSWDYVANFLAYFFYSTQECLLNLKFSDIENWVARIGRRVVKIKGDGFCFINSIQRCLQIDYRMVITIQETTSLILSYLLENIQKYTQFHIIKYSKSTSIADDLATEVFDFFNTRDFNKDVVDLIVQVAADAMGLDIFILQKNEEEKVQIIKCSGGPVSKRIFLRFKRNDLHSQGNHYDAIVKTLRRRKREHVTLRKQELEYPQTSGSEDSENEVPAPNTGFKIDDAFPEIHIGRGKPFPMYLFKNIVPKVTEHTPGMIDGNTLYHVRTSREKWLQDTSDLRYFDMQTSSRAGYLGLRKIGTCQGSYICNNNACAFRTTNPDGYPNRMNWKNVRGQPLKICSICEHIAQREGCGAVKMVEFNPVTNIASVYHMGYHCCWVKKDRQRISAIRNEIKQRNLKGPAKDIALAQMGELIENGEMDWAVIEAEKWINRRDTSRILSEENGNIVPDLNSFDAVAVVKKKVDTKDPYYIYRISNGAMQNTTDYVFKSSTQSAKIALQMDIDGPLNGMQLENAYFDATHRRVHGFKSLVLWTYHPALKKIIRLATMEIRTENTNDIAQFFKLFNEILQEVSGEPTKMFNPRFFICDEAGANYNAIRLVYGDDFCNLRVKGCQFHFKTDMLKKANTIPDEEIREIFTVTCTKMCSVTTVSHYHLLKGKLNELSKLFPMLESWIHWWHQRRSHVFPPFRGTGIPGVNLSEQGNSSLKVAHALRLVNAAKDDVCLMIMQDREIQLVQGNEMRTTGRGPSQALRDARDRKKQMQVAVDFANILDDPDAIELQASQILDPEVYIPANKTKHRPPTKRKGKGKGKAKRKSPKTSDEEDEEDDNTSPSNSQRSIAKSPGKGKKGKFQHLHPPNPPVIVSTIGTSIRLCKGCGCAISKKQIKPPNNFVFRRKGVVGFFNKDRNQYIEKAGNIHFHLRIGCLRKHDDTVELKDIIMHDEVFDGLSEEQMEYLRKNGVLGIILQKKEK